jgi:hypothetical protein
MNDTAPISEQYRLIAKQWVEADAAASLMEETKSAVLSGWMKGEGDIPVSRAEMNVKASKEWAEFIRAMLDARKKAALLKVQLEYLRMQHAEQQSAEATRRHEMRLS